MWVSRIRSSYFSLGFSLVVFGLYCANSHAQQSAPLVTASLTSLDSIDWIHGSADCEGSQASEQYQHWQQIQLPGNTTVFRQNKCSHYEAPFVYLFLGSNRGLLIDTGATEAGGEALLGLIREITELPLVVAHTHSHGDHKQGDSAFKGKKDIAVVALGPKALQQQFGFRDWPNSSVSFELGGGRDIHLLPIPGHSEDDLAFFDPLTQILVTGDSLYPGRLYVKNWQAYRDSIGRLAEWVSDKSILHVLGTHIEMSSSPNVDYPVGTTFQPEEHVLPLTVSDIDTLNDALEQLDSPQRTPLGSYIIWPI